MPGKNKVTLTVANPVVLIYRYKEAPDWKDEKVIERTITQSPFTSAADLPETAKLPQMQDLTLRCGTLLWVPQ